MLNLSTYPSINQLTKDELTKLYSIIKNEIGISVKLDCDKVEIGECVLEPICEELQLVKFIDLSEVVLNKKSVI